MLLRSVTDARDVENFIYLFFTRCITSFIFKVLLMTTYTAFNFLYDSIYPEYIGLSITVSKLFKVVM